MKTENELAESVSLRIKDQFDDAVDVRTWGGPQAILEIVPKGVHKALGLSVIADSLSLDRQDIIAFGDETQRFGDAGLCGLGRCHGEWHAAIKINRQ